MIHDHGVKPNYESLLWLKVFGNWLELEVGWQTQKLKGSLSCHRTPVVGSNRKNLVFSFIKLSSFDLFHHYSILHSNFSKIFKFNKFLKLIFFIFSSSLWFSSFFRKCEKDEFWGGLISDKIVIWSLPGIFPVLTRLIYNRKPEAGRG